MESVRVQQVEREAQVKVQEAEIARRERELIATVLKSADVERQRIQDAAEAERQRLISEAEGRASSIRAQGEPKPKSSSRRARRKPGDEREGGSVPGIQPGGGGRQLITACRKWCALLPSRSARSTR